MRITKLYLCETHEESEGKMEPKWCWHAKKVGKILDIGIFQHEDVMKYDEKKDEWVIIDFENEFGTLFGGTICFADWHRNAIKCHLKIVTNFGGDPGVMPPMLVVEDYSSSYDVLLDDDKINIHHPSVLLPFRQLF